MISFENVTKIYPKAEKPAVQDLTFTIPEGETCVLIGTSGCGKTTTLKMINRLIEPTSGVLTVNGQNVLEQDPVELRRNIGYVIQQIGLFPHMTVRDNIAVVPRLLKWKESRIDERVDELIDMVNMEPKAFRDRFPRELSGGQRQRIGVARALAADPPVMLMDEPFGAIDPINRDSLQNEFLRLQKQLKKTIAFVTHDIDEALKMGTLICILGTGGVIQQLDSPKNILSEPANDFVSNFVGADRGLKSLNLVRAEELLRPSKGVVKVTDSPQTALKQMEKLNFDSILVVGENDQLIGYIDQKTAANAESSTIEPHVYEPVALTEEQATMKDVFSEMLSYGIAYIPVVGKKNKLLGVVTLQDTQNLLSQDDRSE